MHLAAAGDRALLAELGDVTAEELHAAAAYVRTIERVERVIPGHSSLYVIWRGDTPPAPLLRAWPAFDAMPVPSREPREIAVQFAGEDLDEFLTKHRLTREVFLERVQTLTLTARYIGFRAGFAYLDGWPAEWAMPRRATSRPVRAGSFAIAGAVAGFYPIDSPGGWNVLGHTGEDLVDGIEPGERMRLRVVSHTNVKSERAQRAAAVRRTDFELVQSPLVRAVATPFDDVLGELARDAVDGNVVLLECPIAGPRLRAHRDLVIAWADTELRVERVRAGEERTLGAVKGGLRGYLAIGNREGRVRPLPPRGDRLMIRAMRGPHDVGIEEVVCEVTPQLDRVGVRLRPVTPLEIAIPGDLRSIGMQCGSIQLHPDGSLVAMGPDHPVTGGYLQPMTVLSSERWKLAQLRPGERVTIVAAPAAWAAGARTDQEPYS